MKKNQFHFINRFQKFISLAIILVVLALDIFWIKTDYHSQKRQFLSEKRENLNTLLTIFNNQTFYKSLLNNSDSVSYSGNDTTYYPHYNAKDSVLSLIMNKNLALTNITSAKSVIVVNTRDSILKRKQLLHQLDSVVVKNKLDCKLRLITAKDLPANYLLSESDTIYSPISILNTKRLYAAEIPNNLNFKIISRIRFTILVCLLLLILVVVAVILLNRYLKYFKNLINLRKDFTNNMTHELKTPLSILEVSLESMLKYNTVEDPTKAREYLSIMSEEVSRLERMIDTILNQSKLDNNKLVLKSEKIDLIQLISQCERRFNEKLKRLNGQLNYSGVKDIYIYGDEQLLTPVFTNLIENSIKYALEPPLIFIEASFAKDYVEISYKDNSAGIPEDEHTHIFEPFYRTAISQQKVISGFGLGLSYVKQAVELHGGSISLGRAEKGVYFQIKFPRR